MNRNSVNKVIMIDDDDDPGPKKKIKKNKEHQTAKRDVVVNVDSNHTESLIITQKVKVKKQKIQCVMNVKKIHKKKNKHNIDRKGVITSNSSIKRSRHTDNKQSKLKKGIHGIERDVPHCLRTQCASKVRSNKFIRDQLQREKQQNKKCVMSKKSKHSKKKLDLSYEDISSDSLSSSDDERLSILIKRSKEREKLLSKASKSKSCHTKSSQNTVCSETDTSEHSQATLVLDIQPASQTPILKYENNTETYISTPVYNTNVLDTEYIYSYPYSPISSNMSWSPISSSPLCSFSPHKSQNLQLDHEISYNMEYPVFVPTINCNNINGYFGVLDNIQYGYPFAQYYGYTPTNTQFMQGNYYYELPKDVPTACGLEECIPYSPTMSPYNVTNENDIGEIAKVPKRVRNRVKSNLIVLPTNEDKPESSHNKEIKIEKVCMIPIKTEPELESSPSQNHIVSIKTEIVDFCNNNITEYTNSVKLSSMQLKADNIKEEPKD